LRREDIEAGARELPVFPLPRIVLMPRDVLPLHVFEPRYRALVAHALSRDGLIGMATLKPGYEAEYHARPPMYDAIGIGAIVQNQRLHDGRSNIVVEWLARGTAVEELRRDVLFRVFRTEVRVDRHLDADLPLLRQLVVQLGAYTTETSAEALRLAGLPGPELVDHLARRTLESTEDRLAYVGTDSIAERAQILEGKLADLIAAGRAPVADA
jgi:Lon protease-like protein